MRNSGGELKFRIGQLLALFLSDICQGIEFGKHFVSPLNVVEKIVLCVYFVYTVVLASAVS